MAENEEAAAAAPAPAKSGGGKLMFIILGMNVLMMVAVAVLFMRKPAAPAPAAHAQSGEHGDKAEAAEGEHDEKGEKEEAEGEGEGDKDQKGGHGGKRPGPILKLENFVIQLRGVDQDRYVRVSFDIEVSSDRDREVVQARLPRIRDSVITYFSDRTLDELRGSEGIERTKSAVMKRLEEIVPGRRIRALYLTDFIIQ